MKSQLITYKFLFYFLFFIEALIIKDGRMIGNQVMRKDTALNISFKRGIFRTIAYPIRICCLDH